jgi:hypothetical protein
MKRRVISNYGYETHFNGGSLTLRPGLNLIEETEFDAALRGDPRFRQVVDTSRVENSGAYVDWLKDLVTTAPESVTVKNVAALSVDEAQALVRAFKTNAGALQVLAGFAERGGVRAVFAAALGGR